MSAIRAHATGHTRRLTREFTFGLNDTSSSFRTDTDMSMEIHPNNLADFSQLVHSTPFSKINVYSSDILLYNG